MKMPQKADDALWIDVELRPAKGEMFDFKLVYLKPLVLVSLMVLSGFNNNSFHPSCRPAVPAQPHLLGVRGVRGHQEGGAVSRSWAPPPLRLLPGGMTRPPFSGCWLEEEDVRVISPGSTDFFPVRSSDRATLRSGTGRSSYFIGLGLRIGRTGL